MEEAGTEQSGVTMIREYIATLLLKLKTIIEPRHEFGQVMTLINLHDTGGSSVTVINHINLRYYLSVISASEGLVETIDRVNMMREEDVGRWADRAKELNGEGIRFPALMALREIEDTMQVRASESNRDVQ